MFVPESEGSLKGKLYTLEGQETTFLQKIDLATNTNLNIKMAVVCQLVAEGGNLDDILNRDWSFRKLQFYHLIDVNPVWKMLYTKAQNIRNLLIIEDTFKKVKEADLNATDTTNLTKVLKEIQQTIKNNDADTGIKSVTNAYIFQPKAVVDRGWGLNGS